LAVGEPLYHYYGLIFDGVYATEQEIIDDLGVDNLDDFSGTSTASYLVRPGDVRYRDLNGDGDITDEDRTIIGDPNPDFTYALNLNAGYKGFDFSALITGVQGADAFNTNVFNLEGQEGVLNRGVEVLRRWQNPGDITDVPRFRFGRNPNNDISTRYIEDASYARLKNLTLGYSLSGELLDETFNGALSKVRVYAQAQNLVTITNYSGLDPEIEPFYSASGIIQGLNIDRGRGPQPTTFLMGIQIEF
ncbi:MAG: TonB-dependent receptor, partial [Bacteroidota bacterium]